MKYRLFSKTSAPDGATELVLVQQIESFDESLPVQIRIEAALCPPYFRAAAELIDEYDVEFANREIKSIDGRTAEEVFDGAREVRIVYKFARARHDEPILSPVADDVLESDIIE